MATFVVKCTSHTSAQHHGDDLPRTVAAGSEKDAAERIAREFTLVAPGPACVELMVEGGGTTSTFIARCSYEGLDQDGNEGWTVEKLP